MRAWLEVANEMKADLSADRYLTVVGRSAADSFAVLSEAFGGRLRFELASARVVAMLDAIPEAERYPLKAGVSQLLEKLSDRQIPCAVASSSTREEIEARLGAVGVRHYFAAFAGGDEVHRGKPDPAVYSLAASRLGVDATRCIAFEDSRNGARAALAAGANVVLVPDLVQPSSELRSEVLEVLASMEEAASRVQRWFTSRRDA